MPKLGLLRVVCWPDWPTLLHCFSFHHPKSLRLFDGLSAYLGPRLKGGFSLLPPSLHLALRGLKEMGGGAVSTWPRLSLSQQEGFYRRLVCLFNLLADAAWCTWTISRPGPRFSLIISTPLVCFGMSIDWEWLKTKPEDEEVSGCHFARSLCVLVKAFDTLHRILSWS